MAAAYIKRAVRLNERKLTCNDAHLPDSHIPGASLDAIMMWQTYYYSTQLAFVSNVNDYLGGQDEIEVQRTNVGATSHGDDAPAPPHQSGRQDVPNVSARGATPVLPSRRAFLRGAPPQGIPLSGGGSAATGGAYVSRGDAPAQDSRDSLAMYGALGASSLPQRGGAGVTVAPATSAPGFDHRLSQPRYGSMAHGCLLPTPPPRRRPMSSPPFLGANVGGATGNDVTTPPRPCFSDAGAAGSSAGHARAAGGSTTQAAGSSTAHARTAGVATGGAAGSSAAHARAAGVSTGGAAGSSAAHARAARVSTGGAAGSSAVHARAAGSYTGGSAVNDLARAPGGAGGNLSDDGMLDTPLSSLPRRPPSRAALTPTGARTGRVARRPRAPTPRGTPSPSPTRRRRQSPSTPRGVTAMAGSDGPPDGTTLADLLSTTSLGLASVRREITALKRELALTSTQQRSAMNKMDSLALMVENIIALVASNRDIMLELRDKVAAGGSLPPSDGSAALPPTPDLQPGREEEDAAWIVELRPVLVQWLEDNFANAQCASNVWPSSATINKYLQDKIAVIMGVRAERAASMLQSKWRLPVRVKKNAQVDAPSAAVRTVAAKRKTPAYRFLHRGVSHFYQRVGITAVNSFSSRMHSEEGLGTLRRVRGTRTKYEVVFAATEASDMLANDTFIVDAGCRAALMHAAHAVFDRMDLRTFSEPGPSRGGPRNVVCRLAHMALLSLKVRQHLQMRAAPVDTEGNAVSTSGLNVGHRDEWKREMGTLSVLLAVQGDRAVNGLRIIDGEWPGRAMADIVPPPPVGGVPVSGGGDDDEDEANADAGDDGNDGDDDAARGDGDGGMDGATDDWMAGINEELHQGNGEEPPEGEEGDEVPAAGSEDEEDMNSPAYLAARAAERLEFQRAHAESRRRAFARTAEMLRLREAQQMAQRATEKDDNVDDDEEE